MQIEYGFSIGDVLRAKRAGFDIGDIQGMLPQIAIDDVVAFEAACVLYEPQIGEKLESFQQEMKAEKFREFVEGFRAAMSDFFPMYREVEKLKAEALRDILAKD